MLTDDELQAMAEHLIEIEGVLGVILGGSRARGDHTIASDWDLGLYYELPLDVEGLGELARELAGPDARVTATGEWGSVGRWGRLAHCRRVPRGLALPRPSTCPLRVG